MAKADYEFVVVGAGPAGLQMAYFLEREQLNYIILEASDKPGVFFQKYPRHRQLISINKRFNGFPEDEFNWRHDWNSLLSDEPSLRFTKYTKELFPNADDLCRYFEDYASKLKLKIRYNCRVGRVHRDTITEDGPHQSLFTLETKDGNKLTCHCLLMATGAVKEKVPDIKGIELADTYGNHSLDLEEYENKSVCVLGGGNSAFEVADHLAPSASNVQILVDSPVRMAWDTHFVGHLRAINNTVIDMYHLKSLLGIRNVHVKKLAREGDKFAVTFDIHLPHYRVPGPGTGTFTSHFHKVIVATGWTYVDLSLFDNTCTPETHTNGKYPFLDESWQSTVPDMYYIGANMQARDRTAASGFIHGFRYCVRTLFHFLNQRYHGVSLPQKLFNKTNVDDFVTFVIERVSTVGSLYQMNQGVFCDVVTFDMLDKEKQGDIEKEMACDVTYRYDLPTAYVMKQDWFLQHDRLWVVTLEDSHTCFPDGISSTAFFSLPELHDAPQKCTPFARAVFRWYNKGTLEEILYFNGNVLVRADIPLFDQDKTIQRYRNQVKNLVCRTTGLAKDSYDEELYTPAIWQEKFRPWTSEEIEEFKRRETEAKEKRLLEADCPKFGFINQDHLEEREMLLGKIKGKTNIESKDEMMNGSVPSLEKEN